jgi:hypothetical protein
MKAIEQALQKCHLFTQRTNREMGIYVAENQIVWESAGTHEFVKIPVEVVNDINAKWSSPTFVHSHPNASSFSWQDIHMAAQTKCRAGVIASDGSVFRFDKSVAGNDESLERIQQQVVFYAAKVLNLRQNDLVDAGVMTLALNRVVSALEGTFGYREELGPELRPLVPLANEVAQLVGRHWA